MHHPRRRFANSRKPHSASPTTTIRPLIAQNALNLGATQRRADTRRIHLSWQTTRPASKHGLFLFLATSLLHSSPVQQDWFFDFTERASRCHLRSCLSRDRRRACPDLQTSRKARDSVLHQMYPTITATFGQPPDQVGIRLALAGQQPPLGVCEPD